MTPKQNDANEVTYLLELIKELAGWVFDVDENDNFIGTHGNSLPDRINQMLFSIPVRSDEGLTTEYPRLTRMIPVTGIQTELERADRRGIETALQSIEDLEFETIIPLRFMAESDPTRVEQITEWYRQQFRAAVQDLLEEQK